MDLDIGRSLDRISKLPDSVLYHILSFLPTKYAVGTSILSTRWQYLWTCVATFQFNDELFDRGPRINVNGEVEVNMSFTNFVNTVLLLSDVSCFEKFSLKLKSFHNLDILKAWISSAIKHNVQKLELRYSAGHNFDEEIPTQLPCMLFHCKTLVDLRLGGNIYLKVPPSVWLPSLKILEIEEVRYENGDSAHKLIHGCPVLEDLHIYRLYVDKQMVLNISVPTLKRLVLTRLGDDAHVLFSDYESQHKLIVNAPKLQYLDLRDHDANEFSLENLSSLLEARIDVGFCLSGPISSSNLLKLFHGISNVKFLRFSIANSDGYVLPTFHTLHNLTHLRLQNVSDGWNVDLLNAFLEYSPNLEVLVLEILIEVEGHVLPTFQNLTHLRLGLDCISCWNWDLLENFLQCSPNLEVLILEGESPGSAGFWRPPPQVPCCLSWHLKEVEIRQFDGKQYQLELVKYLLKNAKFLKKMTIGCVNSSSCFCNQSKEQEKSGSCVCKALLAFPRGSETCELDLNH